MDLLEVWNGWIPTDYPFLFPGDDALLDKKWSAPFTSWESFYGDESFGARGDTRFHLSLVPVPFTGDLRTAKVVLLLLNPGLEADDYYGEFKVPGFRQRLIDNLRQDFSKTDYPFVYLDPSISWHSGYHWWHGKFQGLISSLSKDWGVTYADARRRFAKLVACVELVPYHSVTYGLPGKIRRALRSVVLARDHVQSVLRPRCETGEALIVVTRQTSAWGLSESLNTVMYSASEARAAYLTPSSRGGGRILEFLREFGPRSDRSA